MTPSINTSVTIADLLANIDRAKYNPFESKRAVYGYLRDVTNGDVDIVDPTTPMVFGMEAAMVLFHAGMLENLANTRRLYENLAQTEEDLYCHLSDKDFKDRFATPLSCKFTFAVSWNDLLSKMVYDSTDGCYKAIIPRNTKVVVSGSTYSLQYPIEFRRYSTGIFEVSFDANISSPLKALSTNIIDITPRQDTNGVVWVHFEVELDQFDVASTSFPVTKSTVFQKQIAFTDSFYYARVYYRNSSTDGWVEIKTTHTDQVFSPTVPTAVLKVYTDYMTVFLPQVYLTNNLISGEVRVDLYTTKGEQTVNFNNYPVSAFALNLQAFDTARDLNQFTTAMADISSYVFSTAVTSGGTNGLTFEELKQRAINNSLGDQVIPITPNQLSANISRLGFDVVKHVDTITDRVYLGVRNLPKPTSTKLITPSTTGISSLISTIDYLKSLPTVNNNGNRITIQSNNLFLKSNGVMQILSPSDKTSLYTLQKADFVKTVNGGDYLYNPFYYVLDSTADEFTVRPYSLDYPMSSNLSFIYQNDTFQLPVSTGSYKLEKTSYGYKLSLLTKSGAIYKQIPDGAVGCQIAFTPKGESNMAYITGQHVSTSAEGERLFEFRIETTHDIDVNDYLVINNTMTLNQSGVKTKASLSQKFYIYHVSNSLYEGYIPSFMDNEIGKYALPVSSSAITKESLDLTFGVSLSSLWTRARTIPGSDQYAVYDTDIPLVYEADVYERDSVTGAIFSVVNGQLVYNVLHHAGDPVLSNTGVPIYKHRAGDVVLNSSGSPVVSSAGSDSKEIDLFLVDGRYFFATDSLYSKYRDELAGVVATWTSETLPGVTNLLEKTKIFFYPKTNLGTTEVSLQSGVTTVIRSDQSFVVDLYVDNKVYQDVATREKYKSQVITTINSKITADVVDISDIIATLRTQLNCTVAVSGLGGASNNFQITTAVGTNRLCLKKVLELQADGTTRVVEDVVVNFINKENTAA